MLTGLRLDHIGYAVADVERYLHDFVEPLLRPASVGPIVEDPVQRVRLAFVELAGAARLEIISPIGADSPVARMVAKQRGSLYHVGYLATGLQTEISRFQAAGCLLVSGPTPAVAFDGRPIAFLMTPQSDLVELIQAALDASA